MRFGSSGQDYLEAIYELSLTGNEIRSVDVALKLGVSRASVSRAVSVLKELGYVEMEKYSLIALTGAGTKAALNILSRHNTLKRFLIDSLGVSEETAEIDACRMEHCISQETFSRLQQHMEERSRLDEE